MMIYGYDGTNFYRLILKYESGSLSQMVDSVIPMTGGEFKAVISLINSKWYISWNTVSYGPDTSAINSGIISLRLNGSTFDA